MNKEVARKLRKRADEIAEIYSNSDRASNFNKEIFTVEEIIPLSEYTSAVIYEKTTGKKVAMFFYYNREKWWNLVPTDSHILGMMEFYRIKAKVEAENYKENF